MYPQLGTLPDLDRCELEPIRHPGAVQPHGALLVLDADGQQVVGASESCSHWLGRPAAELIGCSVAQALGTAAAMAWVDSLGIRPPATESSLSADSPGPLMALPCAHGPTVLRANRNADGAWLLDIEPGSDESAPMLTACQQHLHGLRAIHELAPLTHAAATAVRAMTGFDRVMVYRFDADWNGEVLAESCADDLEPYLGLHYPASDIPRQARELFVRARVRLIADVHYQPSALITRGDANAIDLGPSSLRSVSPVHLEYCRNMGVGATLVGSLVVDGRLWGLVSCHHRSPRHCAPAERDAIGSFCADVGTLIGALQLRERLQRITSLARRRQRLVQLVRQVDLGTLLEAPGTRELLDVVAADGFALQVGDRLRQVGRTPSPERIAQLLARRHQLGPIDQPQATSALGTDLQVDDAGDGVAGALFISLQTQPAVTLAWFRDERSHTVRWGGNPDQAHQRHDDGRISPRRSFEQFLREVRGQALPWSPDERASAHELGSLIEIDALRHRDAFNKTIMDSIPSHLCVLDRQGVIVSVNAAWQRFALDNGARPSDAMPLGTNYRRVCMGDPAQPGGADGAAAWAGIDAVLQGIQQQFAMDYPCDSPTERRWFHMQVHPMAPPAEGVVVVHSNVTQRKLAEEALALSEQRYLTVLTDQTELICRFKADGTILYVNQAFCRFFGRRADQLVGSNWQPVALPEDLPHIHAQLARLSPAQPVVTIENRTLSASGEPRWCQFINRAFFDATGQMVELQAVGRDIHDRKLAELRVQALLREQQAILASPIVGIVRVQARRVVWANAAFAAMLGYAADEVAGLPIRVFFASDEAQAEFVARAAALQAPGEVLHAEVQSVRKNGSMGWFEITASSLDVTTGEQIGAVVDISRRKATEAELDRHLRHLEALVAVRTAALVKAKEEAEQSMASLQAALQTVTVGKATRAAALASMSDAVVICDTEGRLIDFNDAFATFNRFADKAACPRTLEAFAPLLEAFHDGTQVLPLDQWAVPRALRGESGIGVEYTMRRRDTGESWLGSFNFAPIRDGQGAIAGAVMTARDITLQRAADLSLRQAKEAAEAASKAKSTFLSTMSHELRTPMNGIMGLTELAQRRATDPRQADQLKKVMQVSQHLLSIINDLLDMTHIESGRMALQPGPFVLDGLLETLGALVKVQIGSKPVSWAVELAPALSSRVLHGDARRLNQVLLNLAGNAVKFTDQGQVTLRVQCLDEGPREQRLRFEVQDSGIGIAAGDLKRVFLPFEQVDTGTTRRHGGSGLGLAISRQLVELMGGQIGVSSQPGSGSLFWVVLPFGKLAALQSPAALPPANTPRRLLRERHAGAYVLVAEDDELNLEVTRDLLEDCGLVVHHATDGAQAVAMARRTNYDLVLMDVQLPLVDGCEATRQIRQLPLGARVPVVALTSSVYANDETRCRQAGMDDFIGRPVDADELLGAVLRQLDQPRD